MADEQQIATGPQIPRHEAWFDVPGYEGFRVKLWTNFPRRLWGDIRAGDEERFIAAMGAVVLEHNGWRDYDGQPYPSPQSHEFWGTIPTELMTVLIDLLTSAPYQLPNSLSSASGKLTSSASG